MNKVLLVEDNPEKLARVAAVVEGKKDMWSLKTAGDVLSAKAALKSERFDIVLLDINLPRKASEAPSVAGGLEIVRWLRGRGMPYRPPYIVGLTAYAESFDLAKAEFDNVIWRVIETDLTKSEWTDKLARSLDDISAQAKAPYRGDGFSHHVDVLVVTALAEPELEAVLALPGANFARIEVSHDASAYYRGSLIHKRRSLSVVAVAASDKGLSGAAIAATKGIFAFWPRYIYMTGITAGLRKRTKIGDVVFADLAWDWGSGKLKTVERKQVFHPAPYQRRLDETLSNAAKELKKDEAFLQSCWDRFEGDKPDLAPRVLVGAMASGASVLQSNAAVAQVIAQHKDLLAVEMEAFSLMFAAQTAPTPRPLPIVAKAVCDNGDGKKNDKYQKYAAFVSAAIFQQFAMKYLSTEDSD